MGTGYEKYLYGSLWGWFVMKQEGIFPEKYIKQYKRTMYMKSSLSNFKLYRWWKGGCWERWGVENVGIVWHQVEAKDKRFNGKPTPICTHFYEKEYYDKNEAAKIALVEMVNKF